MSCCDFGVHGDCSQGSTASDQCEEASYAVLLCFCTPCDCSAMPLNVTVEQAPSLRLCLSLLMVDAAVTWRTDFPQRVISTSTRLSTRRAMVGNRHFDNEIDSASSEGVGCGLIVLFGFVH